jgi:hypothetical protein
LSFLSRVAARFPPRARPAPRRPALIALLTLALAAFAAQTLALGALRRQPRYDEVAYLSLARDYHRMGGLPEVVRCHLQGLCHEDNRFPTFPLLLQALAHDDPSFFAEAKLLTFATALSLLATVGLLAGRLYGAATGVASVLLLALMPTLGEIASGVLADVLYAVVLFAAVAAIGRCLERGAPHWLGAGALVGLAYLTKGNAHLALLGLLTAGLALHGPRLLATPRPYAAVVGFLAVTFFLLWRNVVAYHGNPFHNFNDRSLWLDAWQDTWRIMRTPEWDQIGLGWYLHHHSPLALVWRLVKGMGQTLGALAYTAGLGMTAGTPAQASPTVAAAAIRIATGAGVLVAAGVGLRDRLRAGHRAEVLAVLHVTFWLTCAFALGGQGVGGVATRFVLPLAALFVPYAAFTLVTRVWPRMPSVRALGAVALLLAVKLAAFAGGLTTDPRRTFDIPPDWAETSAWFAGHLQPGERYVFPYGSLYSTWDRPFPDPDARWMYNYALPSPEILAAIADAKPLSVEPRWDGPPRPIRKVLVDTADRDLPRYGDKLAGPADAHGPLTFLGWPRCFADSGQPSRFLVFCR